MRKVKPGFKILTALDKQAILESLEIAGRVCYKSEEKITETSSSAFVRKLIKNGHEAMIEHYSLSVKFICDRGVSHEIVRHRIASYGQESTRYCNYAKDKFGNEITVVEPCFWTEGSAQYTEWERACCDAERAYFALLNSGASPQEARSVLPNSLKTEIIVTMNMRSWRHFLTLRTASAAHPSMQEITRPLLAELQDALPEIFESIEVK